MWVGGCRTFWTCHTMEILKYFRVFLSFEGKQSWQFFFANLAELGKSRNNSKKLFSRLWGGGEGGGPRHTWKKNQIFFFFFLNPSLFEYHNVEDKKIYTRFGPYLTGESILCLLELTLSYSLNIVYLYITLSSWL